MRISLFLAVGVVEIRIVEIRISRRKNGWCGLFLDDGVEWGKRMLKVEDIKEMENVRNGLNCGLVGIKQTCSYMVKSVVKNAKTKTKKNLEKKRRKFLHTPQCKIDRPGCVSRQILYFSRKIQYHKENVQKTTRLTPIVDAIVSFNHPAKF